MIPKDEYGKTIVTKLYLTKNLDENLKMFDELFKNDNTFIKRQVKIFKNTKVAILFFDGMVNSAVIAENILAPMLNKKQTTPEIISSKYLVEKVLEVNDAKISDNLTDILNAFLYGDSLVLVDGDDTGIILNTKGFILRSIGEPDTEKVLSGPREGFIEGFMMNLSLIRRRISSPDLKFQFVKLGTQTNTTAAICYIEGTVDKQVLDTFIKRVKKFEIDSAIDSNYIVECIKDDKYSPFPTVGTTERPDIFVAKLLEGRVGLILDGTPVAITAPHILMETFQANDDYYLNYLYANTSRILRIIGFILTTTIPAIFLAMITFHYELIPTKLLFSISSARSGVPFPAILEGLGLILVFEILKEAGTRTPSSIGQSLSIVGALVLGQAAVDARFVSAPMVIVVAFSGITALMVPKLKVPAIILRLLYLLLSSVLGLYGLMFGISLTILHICASKSFGVSYVTNISSVKKGQEKDNIVRFPWSLMVKDHRFISRQSREVKRD